MQVSGVLKPVRRVLMHNTTTNEAYKGFEMAVDGKITIAMEEGALRDEIERAGGIGFVAQLTPSGSIQLKLIPFADMLTPEELEKRAAERDKREMELRKQRRQSEQEERERRNEENLRDNARLARSQELADEQRKANEDNARRANTNVVDGKAASPSEEEVDKKMEEIRKGQQQALKSNKGKIAERISPILADLDGSGKPVQTKEQKSQAKKNTVKKGQKTKLKKNGTSVKK